MESPRNPATAGAPGIAQLLTALGRLCEADRIAISELRSIRVVEDEVSIEIVRADGRRRTNTYPFAVLSHAAAVGDLI
jgi:hypothetical protein